MTPAGVLRALNDADVTMVRGPAGCPGLDDPLHRVSDELLEAILRHRWIVIWVLEGQGSGHAWMACDHCDEIALLSVRGGRRPRRCMLTVGCTGTYIDI